MINGKSPYLPKVRTGYHPSDRAINAASVSDKDIHLPNPAVDPIVVNNIAYCEFDYTEDMMDDDIFHSGRSE